MPTIPVTMEPVSAEDLRGATSDEEDVSESFDSSVRAEDPEEHSLFPEDHQLRNAANFAAAFPKRELDDSDMVCVEKNVKGKLTRLFASSLRKHNFLNPLTYRSFFHDSFFQDGSLTDFVEYFRGLRGEDVHAQDPDWQGVYSALIASGIRERFAEERIPECSQRMWVGDVIGIICAALKKRKVKIVSERLFGIRGLLLYTKQDTEIILDEMLALCGYVGKADGSILRGRDVLGVFECKVVNDADVDLPWYTARALLAQILCSMGGTRECKVGLAMSNIGFKVLYRKERDDQETVSFDCFHYPRESEDGVAFFALLHGTDPETISANFDKLFRFLYEIVKTCIKDQPDLEQINVEAPGSDSPINRASIRPRDVPHSDPRKIRRIHPQSPELFQNDENEPTESVNQAMPVAAEKAKWKTSYDFQVVLGDGTMMPMAGMAFSPDYFD